MTKAFLETLVESGPYGKNAAEAADRLISAKLIELMEAGGALGARLEATLAELQSAAGEHGARFCGRHGVFSDIDISRFV